MVARGERSRIALIEAAERLFAERGIESVSLRDIAAAAGQRNNSAAQYHFGDRQGLVAAVYAHRMAVVNDRRHDRLDALEAADCTDDLDAILEATIGPLIAVVDETDGWYARFLVRTRWDTFARQVLVDAPVVSSFRRATDLVVRVLGGDARAHRDRLDQMNTLLVGTIAGWEWRRHNGQTRPHADALCADLVATCRGVLTAPVRQPSAG